MKIWSKGLGRMTLSMDFNNYYAEVNDGTLYIKGKITDPVSGISSLPSTKRISRGWPTFY